MSRLVTAAVLVALAASSALTVSQENAAAEPTVMIAMLVRNKEPYLPYTLTQLSQLDYPKQRLSLWIRSDHNQDRSARVLQTWLERYGPLYSAVDAAVNTTSPLLREDEQSAVHTSPGRLQAVAAMKQEALQKARRLRTDLVWFLDADVILHDSAVLRQLLDMEKPLVSPMLRSDGEHSNVWDGMSEDLSLDEGSQFSEIYRRRERGCFAVSLVRSCVLVDLRNRCTAGLTFVPENLATLTGAVPLDDAVTLALSARQAGLEVNVCNQEDFGQLPVPLTPPQELGEEWRNIVNIKLEALVDRPPLPVLPLMRLFLPSPPQKSWLGVDGIFTITLARRPERRRRLLASFEELGIHTYLVKAADGQQLNDTFIGENSIRAMLGFRNHYSDLPLTFGEIGCFLSHHSIWLEALESDYSRVIVFEDDVRLPADFKLKFAELMDEVKRLKLNWDLIYLYWENNALNYKVPGSEQLVKPEHSISGLAYVLTGVGAQKLVQGRPLQNMIPLDEYIPVMFGKPRHAEWTSAYDGAGRLRALAAHPVLVHPFKQWGDTGHLSDTAYSETVSVHHDEL